MISARTSCAAGLGHLHPAPFPFAVACVKIDATSRPRGRHVRHGKQAFRKPYSERGSLFAFVLKARHHPRRKSRLRLHTAFCHGSLGRPPGRRSNHRPRSIAVHSRPSTPQVIDVMPFQIIGPRLD